MAVEPNSLIEWNTTLQVAVIGASLSAVGWLIGHIFMVYTEQRKQRAIQQFEYTNDQLKKLYGPLVFLVVEGRQTSQDFLTFLGRSYVCKNDEPLPKAELDAWLFWMESEFLPRKETINSLISSKTHLVDEGRISDSYLEFIQHYSSWSILHKRWQTRNVAYSWHSNVNWPVEFENDVINKFNEMKQRHFILLGRLGPHHRRHRNVARREGENR